MYEQRLKSALRQSGRLILISGTAKQEKTVLCQKVIGKDSIIDVSGAQIQSQEDFWNQIKKKIRLQLEVQVTRTVGNKANAATDISGLTDYEHARGQSVAESSNSAIMGYLIANSKVLVLDDFHYVENDLQIYIARILKTEMFNGLKAIVLSVPHRADDVIRHNPDLIGRMTVIEIAS